MAKTRTWWFFTKKQVYILAAVCILCTQLLLNGCLQNFVKTTSLPEMEEHISKYDSLNSAENVTPGSFENNSQTAPSSTNASILNDTANLFFYHETTQYCYGITKDGKEVFAHRDADGTKIDALNSGGTFTMWDESGRVLCAAQYVSNFEVLQETPVKKVRVTYTNTPKGSTTSNTYTFYDNYVKATASISGFSTSTPIAVAFLERHYPNNYVNVEQKMNTNWTFPANGDFPYKELDSYVTMHDIDSVHKLYTFFHGESSNISQLYENYTKDHFILKTNNNQLLQHEVNYKLVFENSNVDRDTDYFALFKAKGQPLTLSITPTDNKSANTTVFKGNNTVLNMNISNLSDNVSNGTLSFHFYDYYGNDLLKENVDLSVPAQQAYNRKFTLSNITNKKTGIYYLDVTLSGAEYSYRELYPFVILSDYTYKYRNTNPFGISGMRFGKYERNDATVYLADSLGMSHARVGISAPEYVESDYTLLTSYLQKLKDKGIQISGQYILTSDWKYPNDVQTFKDSFFYAACSTAPYLSAIEIGNELNMVDYNQFTTKAEAMDYYYNIMYQPALELLNGAPIPVISAGVGLSDGEWLELLSQYGIDKSSHILSTHAYSYPHSPDFTKDPTIEHSFESSLVRVRNYLDKTGDKTWYISEMGLPTTPLQTQNTFSGSDLRTQADYTIREFLLALSYGVDVVESYSFYDQVNMFKGYDNTNAEFHFGMFYDQDYYGRIMPKPYAAAYATMTKELDGVKTVTETKNASNTLRTFQVKLSNGKTLTAAYSNIYRLSNDAVTGTRTPNLPWNNQWLQSETAVFQKDSKAKEIYTIDLMGNKTTYKADRKGKVSIPITGAPVFIYGVK